MVYLYRLSTTRKIKMMLYAQPAAPCGKQLKTFFILVIEKNNKEEDKMNCVDLMNFQLLAFRMLGVKKIQYLL